MQLLVENIRINTAPLINSNYYIIILLFFSIKLSQFSDICWIYYPNSRARVYVYARQFASWMAIDFQFGHVPNKFVGSWRELDAFDGLCALFGHISRPIQVPLCLLVLVVTTHADNYATRRVQVYDEVDNGVTQGENTVMDNEPKETEHNPFKIVEREHERLVTVIKKVRAQPRSTCHKRTSCVQLALNRWTHNWIAFGFFVFPIEKVPVPIPITKHSKSFSPS